jgi:aryl-alcohol dehydrogenase-like predicted oxidoreductase
MKYRNVGKSDLRVSSVGLGCNNFGMRIDYEASREVVHKALDLGITLFDTADIYGDRGGSETILGRALGNRRKDIVLATKFGKPMGTDSAMQGSSRRYIMLAVESSLRRLGTDWIDSYQVHEPDPETPIEETLRALEDLIRQGKVRYAGCSNFPAEKVADAQKTAKELNIHGFISCQDEYSLLVRAIESELIPTMEDCGLGLLPYFPLAAGLLTGKYRRDESPKEGTRFSAWKALVPRYLTEENWNKVELYRLFCADRNRTLLELAFGWLLSKPVVSSVIAGATSADQVAANVAAAGWELSPQELTEISGL